MKKLFAFLAIFLVNFGGIGGVFVYAATGDTDVIVTEPIPGMNCECVKGVVCTDITTKKYTCKVEQGFSSVQNMLGGLIKYSTFIVALLGVLMLVYSGIEMSMSGAFGDSKKAKERISKIILGLVLLFLIGFILNTVAPWIYK